MQHHVQTNEGEKHHHPKRGWRGAPALSKKEGEEEHQPKGGGGQSKGGGTHPPPSGGAVFSSLFLGGAAWSAPSVGGATFLRLRWVVLFPSPPSLVE